MQRFREPLHADLGSSNSGNGHPKHSLPSSSSEVDADPAAQPSMIQQVRPMPRSRENRYLPRSLDSVRPRVTAAVDLAADRDNLRDNPNELARRVTCTLAYT